MSFNLYFAGGGSREADEEILTLDCQRLLSYVNDKSLIRKYFEQGKEIFLDSGAYSAHTKGIEIDVDDYISYINEHDELLVCYAQLDKIPGEFGKPKTKEQLETAPIQSWENYLYMVERVKSPEKLLPIFHQGEDFKHLRTMLSHEPKIDYIGISPANDVATPMKREWIAECFRIIEKSKNPNVKTHAFGMTALYLLEEFPFYSADSTTWLMAGTHGEICTKYGRLIVSETRLKSPKNINNFSPEFKQELEEYVQQYGYNLKTLSEDYKARLRFNIRVLKEWADNYEYKPRKVIQNKLF